MYFSYGVKNRISAAHKLNLQSSRSHSILTIRIDSFDHFNQGNVLSSKIELVDLAGSERIGLTGTEGKQAKESIDINKSLFTLRQVITVLSETTKIKGNQK
jgi:kinesin family protein 4/21/27